MPNILLEYDILIHTFMCSAFNFLIHCLQGCNKNIYDETV